MKEIIKTKNAPEAIGTYSQGVCTGNLIFFSGQIPINPTTGEIPSDIEIQIDQVMKNIDGLLESKNINRNHIIKTTIFLKNLSHFDYVNEAYTKYFTPPYPARSCVEVSKLPKDVLVEIEVIAVKNV